MAKPLIRKETSYSTWSGQMEPGYVIVTGGKNGRRWAPEGAQEGAFAHFQTRSKAENFIARGGMIPVEVVSFGEAYAACGWVEADGWSDENLARFHAWLEASGTHYYGAPREEFLASRGIEQAQAKGLRRVLLEDLS